MGKNWKGPGGGGGRGGGRGGRGGGGRGGGGGSSNDTSSCKGHGAIIGTCDAARERETSKEMVNLLNQAIENMSPAAVAEVENSEPEEKSYGGGSVKDMLAQEIAQVRGQKHSATQNVMSVDTKVKGLVLIKIMRKDLCPVELVKAIFDRVRNEKEPCSRHVVRIIPLQKIFYPNNNDLSDNIANMVQSAFPGAAMPFFEKEIIIEKEEKKPREKRTASDAEIGCTTSADPDSVEGEGEENKRPRIEEHSSSASAIEGEEHPSSSEDILLEPTEDTEDTPMESAAEEPCTIAQEVPEVSEDAAILPIASEEEPVEAPVIPDAPSPSSVPDVPATFYGPLFYSAVFKARSHNLMTRESAQSTIAKTVPSFFKANYSRAKALIVVEVLRNICGASLLKDGYGDYEEFNLKKFQTIHCVNSLGSNLTNFKAKGKGPDLSIYGAGDKGVAKVDDSSAPDLKEEHSSDPTSDLKEEKFSESNEDVIE